MKHDIDGRRDSHLALLVHDNWYMNPFSLTTNHGQRLKASLWVHDKYYTEENRH